MQTGQTKTFSDTIASVVTNKRTRSFVFLIITFIMILAVNGLMPLISGQAHYTADAREYTYIEYLDMKKQSELYDITYASKMKINHYIQMYTDANPDLTPDEILMILPPDNMTVNVYTKFFFQSPWWYVDTALSMLSAAFLFFAIFNYLKTRSKDTNLDHINGEFVIKQLNENYLDPDTFEPWIDDTFNKARKLKQHERNVKHALQTLESKTSYIIRRRFKTYFKNLTDVDEDNLLPVVYKPLTKEERTYMDKKEELLDQLNEEYINEYVVDNEVKNFKAIRAGFVYSGVTSGGVTQDEYSTIKTDNQRLRSTMLSKLIMSASVTLGFASILTVLAVNVDSQNPLWVVMNIFMKIVPLLLQVWFAIDYNNWFMENQLLPNLKYRENIAMLYLAEMKRRGMLTQPVVINKISIVQEKSDS